MASIKISKLKDLSKDLLSNDDVFIVNDANLTTMSIKYGTIVDKLHETDHIFTGDIQFSGSVSVTGVLANRNFYTKTEVDTIVADGDDDVRAELAVVNLKVDDLVTLSGEPAGTKHLVASEFTTDNMQLGGANYTISSALKQLDKGAFTANAAIQAEFNKNAQQDLRLEALDSTSAPKGAVVVNAEAIAALEAAVFSGPNDNAIGDNTTSIGTNTSNIDNLSQQIGTDSVTATDLGVLNMTNITDGSNVVEALAQVNNVIETSLRVGIADNATRVTAAETAQLTDHSELVALYTALATVAGKDYTNKTVQEFATELAGALVGIPPTP